MTSGKIPGPYLALLGCFFLSSIAPVLIAGFLILAWFVFNAGFLAYFAISEANSTPRLEELPGTRASVAMRQISCHDGWETHLDRTLATCDALTEPHHIAGGVPTKANLHLDGRGTIRFVHLTFAPYSPQILPTGKDSHQIVSWAEVVARTFPDQGCRHEYLPFASARMWDCGDQVIAHTAADLTVPGHPAVHLWIGTNTEDLRPSVYAEGVKESRWVLEKSLEAAVAHFEADRPILADESLLHAQFVLDLLPAAAWDPELRTIQEEVEGIRQVVQLLAAEERRLLKLTAPLPSFFGLFHPQVTLDRSRDEVLRLLGLPDSCDDETCSFVSTDWRARVSFDGGSSREVHLTLPGSEIALDEEALALFDLPRAAPTRREDHRLIWEDFGGLTRIELIAAEDTGFLREARFQ